MRKDQVLSGIAATATLMLSVMPVGAVAQALSPTAAAPPPAIPEKKTCRRFDVTGSIIPFRRVCDTAANWTKFDQASEQAWETARYSKNRSWSKSAPTS